MDSLIIPEIKPSHLTALQPLINEMSLLLPNLAQADPESVAVEVGVLPGLSWLSSMRHARLPRGSTGWGRGGVLLIAEMFVLQNVIGVLPLQISRNRRHDGSVDR